MAKYSNLKYSFSDGRQGHTGAPEDYHVSGKDVQNLLAGQEPIVQATVLDWLAKLSHAPLKSVVRTKIVMVAQKYAHQLQTA